MELNSMPPELKYCHPVAEAHWFLERAAFIERRSMEILSAWVWNTANLDLKLVFGLHAYEDASHADLCLRRYRELQSGLPSYGWDPRPLGLEHLDAICQHLCQAPSVSSKLGGLYGVFKPWLLSQYEAFVASADSILEAPTIRILQAIASEKRAQIKWGHEQLEKQLAINPNDWNSADEWRRGLTELLENLDGARDLARDESPVDQPLMDLTGQPPACDDRFDIVYYTPGSGPSRSVEFDPKDEAEIQQIMLSTLVAVEAEAAELVGRILVEFPGLPWEMRYALCRQMWDECRHAASQWRLLRNLGADLGKHPSIAYINRFVGDEPDVLKRLIVLQRVVEGISVDQHRPRGRYFLDKGVYPVVQMFDYILADEDNHIGLSSWIRVVAGDDAEHLKELARYQAVKEQEYLEYSEWLVSKRRDLARLYSANSSR
jgi:uncharacterized ferritin-like protein (DUF455 family)